MNKILLLGFIARLILTPIIALGGSSYYKLVLILILLDIIDCNPLVVKLFSKEQLEKQQYCSKDPLYSEIDKWLDIYQYLFAMIFLKDIFSLNTYYILILLLLYRVTGVALYHNSKDSWNFVYFPDFIKEYIILVAIFGDNIPLPILTTAIIGKFGYEYLMHKSHIMITLYKKIFE